MHAGSPQLRPARGPVPHSGRAPDLGIGKRCLRVSLCAVLSLPLAASPARAEGWTCRLTERCVTGEACVRLATPARASLTISDDGTSLRISVAGETSEMRRLEETRIGSTYWQGIDGRTTAFLTIYRDGTLALSSHDATQDDIAVIGAIGSCTRAVG